MQDGCWPARPSCLRRFRHQVPARIHLVTPEEQQDSAVVRGSSSEFGPVFAVLTVS